MSFYRLGAAGHHQDGPVGSSDDLVGDAAEKQTLDPAPSVSSYYDQVGLLGAGELMDLLRHTGAPCELHRCPDPLEAEAMRQVLEPRSHLAALFRAGYGLHKRQGWSHHVRENHP